MISRRTPWIAAGLLAALLTTTFFAAQKTESPEVLLRRAVQKEKVDGDKKAAIELYKQVLAALGASQKLKSQAQDSLGALSKSAAPTGLTDRRICSDCRGDSISADGRFVVSMGDEGLTIRDVVSGQVTLLLAEPGYSPILSPDMKQIIYLGGSAGESKKKRLSIVANQVGAKPRILNDNPEYYGLIPAAWARDGKSVLVMADKQADHTWTMAWVSIMDGSVKSLKSLGWRFQFNRDGMGLPSLSPDGQFIAYAARVLDIAPNDTSRSGSNRLPDSNDTHIYVLAADGSKPEVDVVTLASINEGPVWTPDGKSLLFVSDRNGSFGLWSVALQDRALTPVRQDTGELRTIGMTRSGTYVYSRTISDSEPSFVISETNGSAARGEGSQIPETVLGTSPEWSPDGKSIAFVRSTNTNSGGKAVSLAPGLFVYSPGTKDEQRYVPTKGLTILDNRPQWFHDGKKLVQYVRDSKGDQSLYRVDLKTHEFKLIVPIANSNPVALSSDDKTMYLIERGKPDPGELNPGATCHMSRIVAVDINSSQKKQVVTIPSPGNVVLSPDDKTLYMEACDRADVIPGTKTQTGTDLYLGPYRRIVAVDIATGQQKEIFAVQKAKALGGRLSLNPIGDILLEVVYDYVDVDLLARLRSDFSNHNVQLIRVGIDGTAYQELYMLPTGSISSPAWTSDGEAIIFHANSRNDGPHMRIPADGGIPVIIPSLPPRDELRLSPDGSRNISTNANAGNVRQLWALENVSSASKTAK